MTALPLWQTDLNPLLEGLKPLDCPSFSLSLCVCVPAAMHTSRSLQIGTSSLVMTKALTSKLDCWREHRRWCQAQACVFVCFHHASETARRRHSWSAFTTCASRNRQLVPYQLQKSPDRSRCEHACSQACVYGQRQRNTRDESIGARALFSFLLSLSPVAHLVGSRTGAQRNQTQTRRRAFARS